MNVPELIIKIGAPPLPDKIKIFDLPHPDICAITGQQIQRGVRAVDIVTDATNQPHETFKYASEYVSIEAATVFKWVIGGAVGNMFATTEMGAKPMVSRDSAQKQNRLCWVDFIKTLTPGTKTVAIFTQEAKRRLWPFATIGIVGEQWQVYLYTDDYQGNITVSYFRLLECINLLETLYNIGFNKFHMRQSLYDFKTIKKLNLPIVDVNRYEIELTRWRNMPEFWLAIFIIQKPTNERENLHYEQQRFT